MNLIVKNSAYPWSLLLKTLLLWVTYVTCGMSDSVRGPTLMDLKDLVQEDISSVSTIFAFKSFGGLLGTLMVGILLDRFNPSVEYLYLAVTFFIKSLATLLLPLSPNLMVMQSVEFVYGFFHGGFHSVANTLLLRIWSGSGHNSSPYMYALHFSYGIGALVTPLLAKPFLSVQVEPNTNTTLLDIDELELGNNELWTVKTLYPIIFLIMTIPAPFYIWYFIREKREEQLISKSQSETSSVNEQVGQTLSRKMTILLMAFSALFYFTMAGIEHGFRSFTAVFCVNSSLELTKDQAADILAILYVTFAFVRGLLIPLSTVLSSTGILATSCLTLLVSTTMLSIAADTSLPILQTGVALSGAGIASMFAAGMLWLRTVVTINNRIAAVICFSCRISEQFYSLVIGQVIKDDPMVFLNIMSINIVCVIVCLIAMNLIAKCCSKPLIDNERKK